VLGITLPTTPPFDTHGTLVKDGVVWKAVFESASIGSSRLDGAFTYDKRPKVPLLSGRLGGSRVLLADLGPTIGTPAPGSGEAKSAAASGGRVIPDKKFDLPSLRAMDANILINVGMFGLWHRCPRAAPQHARSSPPRRRRADGRDFEGTTAQGQARRLPAARRAAARKALWTADMRLLGVNLAQWLRIQRKGDAPPYLSGKLDALVKVKGSGPLRRRRSWPASTATCACTCATPPSLTSPSKRPGIERRPGPRRDGQGRRCAADPVQRRRPRRRQGVARPKVFVVNTRDRRSGSTARCRFATRASTCDSSSRRRTSAR
jgi:hypothetical protein